MTAVVLRRDAKAPRRVRRAVHDACRGSALPPRLVDDAVFVAGELATTSIRQANGPLRIAISCGTDDVTVRVRYPAHPWCTGRSTAVGAMRSWDVVKRLSTSFGYRVDGKDHEIWASLGQPTTGTRVTGP